jgi:hypothetical protein
VGRVVRCGVEDGHNVASGAGQLDRVAHDKARVRQNRG